MKLFLTILISMISMISLQAENITFKKIWIEHNVMQNGVKGMKVHVAFDISGLKDYRCTAVAFFDQKQGEGIKDKNGKYCTTGGTVCSSVDFCPPYQNTTYSDLAIFIPIEELHLLPGTHTYHTRVFVNPQNRNYIGHSDFIAFEGTVNNTQRENSNMVTCTYCIGSGRCNKCNGIGILCAFDVYRTCFICQGSGVCPICKGERKIYKTYNNTTNVTIQLNNPGYSEGYKEDHPSPPRTEICHACNGTGKGMDQITYSTNYTGTSNDRYCSKCGTTGPAHSHHQPICTGCYGKGRITIR